MKIQRTINGTNFNIELLPEELVEAYFEQQEKYDIEDVVSFAEAYDEEELKDSYGCTYKEILDNKEDIAYRMRKNIDKYDMEWSYAREEAVRDVMRSLKSAEFA